MPFTPEATDAFFEDDTQMHLSPEARARLAKDGITSVMSLGHFYPDNIYRMRAAINYGKITKSYIGEHSIIRLVTAPEAIR